MSITVRQLKAQCNDLAEDLLRYEQTSVEALLALKPGGADNPKRDTSAWVRYYGQLQLLRGRAQGAVGPTARGAQGDDSLALAALAAMPVVVRVADGHEYVVHPKSLSALLHCHAREIVLGRLAALVASLKDADAKDEHVALVHEALGEIDYQTQVLAWIACHDQPGLPFPRHERRPVVPEQWANAHALSVLEINRAFARVNWVNLRAMQSLIEPDPDAGENRSRPSWSMFMGSLAIELHEDPMHLIENRALVSVMASTQLAASSHRAAMADAKRKSERVGAAA